MLVICIGICNYALGLHCYIFQAFLENDVLMLQQSINAFFRVPILQDPFFVANSTYVPIIYNVDLLLRMILKHLDMNLWKHQNFHKDVSFHAFLNAPWMLFISKSLEVISLLLYSSFNKRPIITIIRSSHLILLKNKG